MPRSPCDSVSLGGKGSSSQSVSFEAWHLQVSLSALDRRIATLFVFWDVFNVFLGGMFAGSAFSQLGVIINKPGSIPSVVGTALPASSNFFINTLILKVCPVSPSWLT